MWAALEKAIDCGPEITQVVKNVAHTGLSGLWRERFVHVSYWEHQGMIDIIVDLIHGAVVALEWIIRIGVFNSGTASTQSQCGSSKAKTHGFFKRGLFFENRKDINDLNSEVSCFYGIETFGPGSEKAYS